MKFKSRILNHFECQPDFWQGTAFRKAARDINDAMADGEFIAMIGDPGCGKKTVLNSVCDIIENMNKRSTQKHHIIEVQSIDKERIRIRQIANAIVYQLGNNPSADDERGESPKRDLEALARQTARLLGKAVVSNKEKVTVIIYQAHNLHGNTIRAIKELRELKFLGVMELFGVVLIGHRPLKGKIESLEDVVLRTEMLVLDEAHGWMDGTHRLEYLKDRFGELLNPAMRRQIAIACKTPLAMDRLVYEKMKEVYTRGEKEFKESDFLMNLQDLLDNSKISLQKVANETPSKLSKSTVARIVSGDLKDFKPETIDEVKKTIADITSRQVANRKVA